MKILPSFASQIVSNYDPSASAESKAAARADAASRAVPVDPPAPATATAERARERPERGSGRGARRQLRLIAQAVRSGLRSVVDELERSGVGDEQLARLRGELKQLYTDFRTDLRGAFREARASGDREELATAVRRSFNDLVSGVREATDADEAGQRGEVGARIDVIARRFASLYGTLTDVLAPVDPRVDRALSAYEG